MRCSPEEVRKNLRSLIASVLVRCKDDGRLSIANRTQLDKLYNCPVRIAHRAKWCNEPFHKDLFEFADNVPLRNWTA
jgi:hypothetical protein